MYSVYQIYQSDKPVYSTYHSFNPDFADTTKLDLILNSPITPYYLVDAYFKQPELFSIKTIKNGIDNSLEAFEALQTHINEFINSSIIEPKPTPITRKPRTKKAQQSKTVS